MLLLAPRARHTLGGLPLGDAENTAPVVAPPDAAGRIGAAEDWFLVAPFGRHPQGDLVQVLDKVAATALHFEFALAEGFAGADWRGLPIFIGHPDAEPERYADERKYGSVRALEIGGEGLLARAWWTEAGRRLLDEGAYDYPSPFWDMAPVSGEPLTFRPVRLRSIGLTNQPNLPGRPFGSAVRRPREMADAGASESIIRK